MSEDVNSETIPAIDDSLRRLETRIISLNINLHDGLHGETPNDSKDEVAVAMPTASLASIARRIRELHTSLDTAEAHVSNIHQSDKVSKPTI